LEFLSLPGQKFTFIDWSEDDADDAVIEPAPVCHSRCRVEARLSLERRLWVET
jgi:hypothetical protein